MRARRIIVLAAALAPAGCGGALQSGIGTDAGDGPAPASDAGPVLRDPGCGGTVQTTGTASGEAFDASYIRVRFLGGDCSPHLYVTVATSDHVDSNAIQITLIPDPTTDSFVGHFAAEAMFQQGTLAPVQIAATADVTAAPDVAALDNGTPTDPVTGTFSIDVPGLAVSGNFSSPVCQNSYCI